MYDQLLTPEEFLILAQQHMSCAEEMLADPNCFPGHELQAANNYALMAQAITSGATQNDTSDELEVVTGYVIWLLDTYHLWSEEGTFTFPDGMTIEKED